ncbi:orotate phosphoribosyltransferase [Alicyclobacillus tolerans]|uniref:Orotate phosphoribosyltransferase n=2 Tax=Alicyclobacillus tolerans TaxID=90970 RepID=A0A1M6Q6Y2_9BACL|nr:orotate phosphoribosyltransferase [Alicyclobacillus tengchongensis]SHK16029.1 orotate phosphoribosyltransferase [Alicyclobacillus montanus]
MRESQMMLSTEEANELARGLLQIEAVQLRPDQPFTWSSGWKSPIYCDNRKILAYPLFWDSVILAMEKMIRTFFPAVDVIAGTATAGIPHAARLSANLRLPMAYVRSSAKEHGMGRQVEGRVQPGLKAVVIEDTLSTGRSAFSAAKALQVEQMETIGIVSIFSYDFEQITEKSQETRIPYVALVHYSQLISAAVELGILSSQDKDRLEHWRKAPEHYV